ncbi:Ca(2+)-dependent cysteine protease [Entomophthora muscae]|uniref:Ca(2+)-dependent cysteine protease n=1 Tax=Entomophthora muscae TaxID=34485 RepID=A0ACC2T536_9FUNG|nr:Ca(2+)-dependent cysteine protease [Entomophthora muscae]
MQNRGNQPLMPHEYLQQGQSSYSERGVRQTGDHGDQTPDQANEMPFNFTPRDHMYSGEVSGQQISLSDCKGNKKALLIGINYFGSKAELKGCINDVQNISNAFLPKFGFDPTNVTILTDDQQHPLRVPTHDNIIGAMRWLVEGASPGDSLFLHYSGHGGTKKDEDGDEEDGYDETILPLDFEQKGEITDDTLFDILIRDLPKGVRLTAIFDSCHSGSVLDLPYTYKNDGSIAVTAHTTSGKEIAMSLLKAGLSFSQGKKKEALGSLLTGIRGFLSKPKKSAAQLAAEKKAVVADVIQFAGCRDDQTSADACIDKKATGAMSYALLATLRDNPDQTYLDLLNNLRQILCNKYTQIPQISTGYPMDLNNPFFL